MWISDVISIPDRNKQTKTLSLFHSALENKYNHEYISIEDSVTDVVYLPSHLQVLDISSGTYSVSQ